MGVLDQIIRQKQDGKKVIIYCAGLHGILFYDVLKICGVSVDFFSDSDSRKWGRTVVDGVVCVSPDRLKEYDCVGFICVGKPYYNEIRELARREQLFEIIEISRLIDEVIENHRNLYFEILQSHAGKEPADIFYDLRPNKKPAVTGTAGTDRDNHRKKAAVYTAVFGGYDAACFAEYQNQDLDYFYVSDVKPEGLPEYYQWVNAGDLIPARVTSPIKRNRYVKMHPHLFLKAYPYSIYLDGNITVKGDLLEFLRRSGSRTGIGVFMHPMRECVYYEALSIVNFKRVNVEDVRRQMNRYFEEGMPCRYGLAEMPVIVREHMKKECVDVMETWWREFDRESQRDQLSFMYALWKNKFGLDDLASLGENVRQCGQIEFRGHIRESREVKNENGERERAGSKGA